MSTSAPGSDSRSLTDLLKDLRNESSALIRQEVALAKTEMGEKAAKYGRNAGYLGAGFVVLNAAVVLILAALGAAAYVGLAQVMEPRIALWLGPLLVGLLTAAVGYGLVQKAVTALKHETVVPEKTMESLKENQQWLQRKATT